MTRPGQNSKRVTIKDIARVAGVDPSTVTRALQGSERVKRTTRDKITALAAEMGYVPDIAARTLVNRRSKLVGVVIPDMTNPFFADFCKGIEDEALAFGLRVLIIDTHAVDVAEREAVQLFRALKVDGVVVPMARCPQAFYDSLGAEFPVVHVNNNSATHAVNCDTRHGGRLVMEHLLQLGHTRIAFIRGPGPPGPDPKLLAYEEALAASGLKVAPDLMFALDKDLRGSSRIAAEIRRLPLRPTAIFCHNDVNAIKLIHDLRDRGLEVPGDISIVGHDDIDLARYAQPPLTTVAWPMYELGQCSLRSLRELSLGRVLVRQDVSLPQLRVRKSTAAPGGDDSA